MNSSSLDELRGEIDALDDDMLTLLERRADLAERIAAAKRSGHLATYDPEREREVLRRLEARGAGRFPSESIRAVYREIMSACLAIQQPPRVAFLGPAGTFSHAAARELFGLAVRYSEAATMDGVFDAVRRGDATYGVVPIENSTEGSVRDAIDALIDGDVSIRQELVLEVNHCLISAASGLTDVARVYSHPQALAQCRGWLAKNLSNAQLVQTPSTAAAAREAVSDTGGAAIGTRLAAELNGLPVLRERVQDVASNVTRFVMLAQEDAPPTGRDRTTLTFAVQDRLGALRRVLEVFDEHGINLSRIESRPSRQKAWDYVFLADLDGHRLDTPIASALDVLTARCPMLRVLGSYPRADTSSS